MRLRVWLGVLRKHWVVYLGFLGIIVLVVAVSPRKVAASWAGADVRFMALMLPVVFLLYLCHSVAWWIALQGVNARVGIRQAVQVTFISQAFDLLPGGDLWRVPIMKSEDGSRLNTGDIVASVVFDDLIYFFTLTLVVIPAAILVPTIRIPLALALVPQVVIFIILLWPSLYTKLATSVGRLAPFKRFATELNVLGPSFRHLCVPRTLLPVMVVDSICVALAVSLYALALDAVHTTGLSLSQIIFTYAVGQVVSGLTIIPAALGTYEGLMTGLMALQGANPASATAAILLYRAVNDFLMALVGLIVAGVVDRGHLYQLRHSPRPKPMLSI